MSRMIEKRPMELLSTSVMGGVVASSGRSSGTPFRQNRMASRTEQAPDHESDPEAWLTDKILDT